MSRCDSRELSGRSTRLSPSTARIKLHDDFWKPRQELLRTAVIPLAHSRFRREGRFEAMQLDWRGECQASLQPWWELDLLSWLESAVYVLGTAPDPRIEAWIEELVHLFCRAQHPDGYLNIYVSVTGPSKRWTNLRDGRELHAAGRLIESAIAHYEQTGTTLFLETARRSAECLTEEFGPEPWQRKGYCGFPWIESSLVKLYRIVPDPRFLSLARFFLMQRGLEPYYFDMEASRRGEPGVTPPGVRENTLSHLPVTEQVRPVGYAPAAMSLYCGMTDVAVESGDEIMLAQVKALWREVAGRHLFVTGGIGAVRSTRGFGEPYGLADGDSFCETCAAQGWFEFSHRLLLATGESEYADEMERVLFNTLGGAMSLDGRRFFSANPLEHDAPALGPESACQPFERAEWVDPACCPCSVMRGIAGLGRCLISLSEDEISVNLYASCESRFGLRQGEVRLRVKSEFPWRGVVSITIRVDQPIIFCLRCRVPAWCEEAQLSINGQAGSAELERGYFRLHQLWRDGDEVELRMPMRVRRIYSDARVSANLGKVALQRGPIIYCIEGIDFLGSPLQTVFLPADHELSAQHEPNLLGGVTTVRSEAFVCDGDGHSRHLYRLQPLLMKKVPFLAVPFFARANRGLTEMRVWVHEHTSGVTSPLDLLAKPWF